MFAYLLYCWPKVLIESLTSLTNTALSCCAFNIPRALTQLSCCHNLSSPLSIITRVNPEEITNTLALNLIDWFEFWIRIVFHSMQSSCISWGGGGWGGGWVTCALPFNWLDRKLCWKGFLLLERGYPVNRSFLSWVVKTGRENSFFKVFIVSKEEVLNWCVIYQ